MSLRTHHFARLALRSPLAPHARAPGRRTATTTTTTPGGQSGKGFNNQPANSESLSVRPQWQLPLGMAIGVAFVAWEAYMLLWKDATPRVHLEDGPDFKKRAPVPRSTLERVTERIPEKGDKENLLQDIENIRNEDKAKRARALV